MTGQSLGRPKAGQVAGKYPPPRFFSKIPNILKVIEGTPDYDLEKIDRFLETKEGKGCLRAESKHEKSVSSAYWDPRGRSIVSTSYDDSLRCKSSAVSCMLAVHILKK